MNTLMRKIFLTILLVWLCAISSAQDSAPILGILEDTPGHYAGDPHYRSVRVVFAKHGKEWIAFQSNCSDEHCLKSVAAEYPKRVDWTVVFDGRSIGHLITKAPAEFEFYSTVGQEQITGGVAPLVGKPSQQFGGFPSEAVLRPLVTSSKPFFEDPERWKHASLSTDLLRQVRKQFHRRFPKVSNCATPEENIAKVWDYHDSDIRIATAYSSNRGWSIARVQLEPYRCDGPDDDAFVDQWFVVKPDSTVSFLGSAMWLVDAGDYDNDGRSELIFSIDDYNRGGYRLFYDDFSRSATFEFGYH